MFVAYALTIALSPTLGIISCLILSALVIIRRSTHINVSVLGEIEVSNGNEVILRYVDIKIHPEAFVLAQIVPLQIKGSLEYFNAARISRRVEMLTDGVAKLAHEELHGGHRADRVAEAIRNSTLFISRDSRASVIVILDFSQVEEMDSSAAWELKQFVEKRRGDRILFSGLQALPLQLLQELLDPGDVYETFEEAMAECTMIFTQNTESVHSFDLNQASLRSLAGLRLDTGLMFNEGENQLSLRSVRSLRSLQYANDADSNGLFNLRSLRIQPVTESRPDVRQLFAQPQSSNLNPGNAVEPQDTITAVLLNPK